MPIRIAAMRKLINPVTDECSCIRGPLHYTRHLVRATVNESDGLVGSAEGSASLAEHPPPMSMLGAAEAVLFPGRMMFCEAAEHPLTHDVGDS